MEILFAEEPAYAAMLCRLMADDVDEARIQVDYVIGIETDGTFIAEYVSK